NPFNPVTTIKYQLPIAGFVTIKIYDMLGKEVVTLVNQDKQAGYYEVNFNAGKLSSGIYFYKMVSGDFVSIKKLVILK
ncbi:MAG: T9SS type A sorting domain-containing protein, partial [Ignavibacteriae bacterium]|nr:T9SS type A sorting domain-containing protein [Ignavibacteriota bacterium]